jgi:hypothetical protein
MRWQATFAGGSVGSFQQLPPRRPGAGPLAQHPTAGRLHAVASSLSSRGQKLQKLQSCCHALPPLPPAPPPPLPPQEPAHPGGGGGRHRHVAAEDGEGAGAGSAAPGGHHAPGHRQRPLPLLWLGQHVSRSLDPRAAGAQLAWGWGQGCWGGLRSGGQRHGASRPESFYGAGGRDKAARRLALEREPALSFFPGQVLGASSPHHTHTHTTDVTTPHPHPPPPHTAVHHPQALCRCQPAPPGLLECARHRPRGRLLP